MTEHYYSPSPEVKREPREVALRARNREFLLHSDAGVFSKRGLDFGTRVMIEAAELPDGAQAVDLGCGYGPVAAVLGSVYPTSRWTLVDVNERAVELARQNTAPLGNRATVLQSDGFAAIPDLRADAVFLNPPIRAGKAVVYRLFEEAARHLRARGELWVVIQKKQGAKSAQSKLMELFESVEVAAKDGGYFVYRCRESVLTAR
ncbi:methyltransferase [Alicyclobacillus tolerans]|uniref:class I SAM-dependent methyltransferase n=1 Tax=Alicyclobacillus tolerans TaxID=90970 RepID=UPI001EFFA1B7|nr:methyltransferase [Alicyclobacillus tolerans]MCF8566018.1 methyltransferase [Alicyclobacillus tolerans]